jgi:hypothetical protein
LHVADFTPQKKHHPVSPDGVFASGWRQAFFAAGFPAGLPK